MPGVGDTRYVPSAEEGNGGTVSQVTVLGDWDEERDLGDRWVVSQGSTGEGGGKGKKGKKRKREKDGGTFRVPGELLVRTPEEAEAHLRAALVERDDGDDGDDEGDEGDDKGEGVDKGGEVGGDTGTTTLQSTHAVLKTLKSSPVGSFGGGGGLETAPSICVIDFGVHLEEQKWNGTRI